ncbi:hypothetical protein [Kitasatospora sp. NPDC017646]|uniref:hypothetical protein n=1 Tax=Kitasatospora sp. NPDC017646 TaxID=3364024 RepID=UPI00378FED76
MYVEHGTEASTPPAHLLERVAVNTVTITAREARLRLRAAQTDRQAPAPHAAPTGADLTERHLGHARPQPERAVPAVPAVPAGHPTRPHRLEQEPVGHRAAPEHPGSGPGEIGELRRALGTARSEAFRLRDCLAGVQADLDASRQETARAVQRNDELGRDLRSSEAERQRALDLAERADALRAAAERARDDAELRAARLFAHREQAEQAAQAALAWAHQTHIARDAACADAARCQQEAAALEVMVAELRGVVTLLSAERDAARTEAQRALGQVDRWTSHALEILAVARPHDSRLPAVPDHLR